MATDLDARPGPPTLDDLLAFHARRRTSTAGTLAAHVHTPPTDALKARLRVNKALWSRGQHPRQALPR